MTAQPRNAAELREPPACLYEHPECASCATKGLVDGADCGSCQGYGWLLCAECQAWIDADVARDAAMTRAQRRDYNRAWLDRTLAAAWPERNPLSRNVAPKTE